MKAGTSKRAASKSAKKAGAVSVKTGTANLTGTITITEALKICADKKFPYTRMGLTRAARVNGFMSSVQGQGIVKLLLDKNLFNKWLAQISKPVPAQFISLSDARAKFKYSRAYLYKLISDKVLSSCYYGPGRRCYVLLKQLEAFYKNEAAHKRGPKVAANKVLNNTGKKMARAKALVGEKSVAVTYI